MVSEIITSLDNPMIKEARKLSDKKFRRFYGKFLIEGEKLVKEAVCGALEVDKIFVNAEKISEFGEIFEMFSGNIVPVSAKVMNHISETNTPQGIIAEVFMKETGKFSPEADKPILILDRIQDPGNMGTIIRTSAATGIQTVVLIDSVDPYSPKVVRSSSGGIFYLDIFRMSEKEIINYCLSAKKEILVADMNGENIFKTYFSGLNFALVIGNEGQGVSETFKAIGKKISLPMKSQMESLNAGVSASVIMYELLGKTI